MSFLKCQKQRLGTCMKRSLKTVLDKLCAGVPFFPPALSECKGSMENRGAQGKAGGNELDFLV